MASTTSKTAALDSPLYAGRRRRNAIAKGLALSATIFGLGWLVLILGVLLSAVFFMRKVGKTIAVTEIETPEEGVLRYRVTGQLFFASADLFAASFEHHGHPKRVEIDMTDAHLWDLTGVAAVDKVVFRYRRQGAQVEVIGMNQAARTLVDQVGRFEKEHLPTAAAH